MSKSTRVQRYEAQIRKLVLLLRTGPWSATQIAKQTDCTKPSVYSRLAEVRRRGLEIRVASMRVGSRGPCAQGYYL